MHLFGFGMNPGIVEFMKFMIKPEHDYIACVFETYFPREQFEERILPLFGRNLEDCFR